jgi:hypothetical protein
MPQPPVRLGCSGPAQRMIVAQPSCRLMLPEVAEALNRSHTAGQTWIADGSLTLASTS